MVACGSTVHGATCRLGHLLVGGEGGEVSMTSGLDKSKTKHLVENVSERILNVFFKTDSCSLGSGKFNSRRENKYVV